MSDTLHLTLKGGQLALIDAKDYDRLSTYAYRKSGDEIVRTLKKPDAQGRETRSLKHDVLRKPEAAVRYVDGNCLDNRRTNLQIVRDPKKSHIARFEAMGPLNREVVGSSPKKFHSEVPGVTFRKDRAASKPWRVRVQVEGKPLYLGHYKTREEAENIARKAYGRAA